MRKNKSEKKTSKIFERNKEFIKKTSQIVGELKQAETGKVSDKTLSQEIFKLKKQQTKVIVENAPEYIKQSSLRKQPTLAKNKSDNRGAPAKNSSPLIKL